MKKRCILLVLIFQFLISGLSAQNPLIMDQFTADPTARVFEGKLYVYPSHDINCGTNWFCMKDYHVFSSENLVDWTDHGMIVTQENVDWVDSNTNSMWAPDCFEKDGKYYFYFPAIGDSLIGIRGMAVGVAVSDTPYGPFNPEPGPIEGISGIDPNIFLDKDGQHYIYWAGMGNLFGAGLKENMLELSSEPKPIRELPEGMKEGPFVFEREGIYYFTFPHVIEETEALVYATGNNPLGPFEYQGIIMDEHPSKCWTNHHSILEYQGQWYLFYHHNDLSPSFDKNRSIRADSLFFNQDGTIKKVIPTFRGVGITRATENIQIDRYSEISKTGASIMFLDTTDTFQGWKSILDEEGSWIRYNSVEFGPESPEYVVLKVRAATGSAVALQVKGAEGSKEVKIKIPRSEEWTVVRRKFRNIPAGIQHLTLSLEDTRSVEVDWISFE